MQITHALLAAAAVASTLTVTLPASAATTPVLSFARIQYDPSGPDKPATHRQLDREWVTVRNTSKVARQLKGFRVHDAQRHTYVFKALVLKPGASVKLHTGSGKKTRADVYWGQRNFIWNNGGDTATLADKAGKRVDSCRWTRDGSGAINC